MSSPPEWDKPPVVLEALYAARGFLGLALASLGSALLLSATVHVLVIFGLEFKAVNPHWLHNPQQPIDVVLVNAKSKDKPLQTDVLAQHNLDGGGNIDQERFMRSPLPADATDQAPEEDAALNARIQALEQRARMLLHRIKSDYQAPSQPPQKPSEVAQPAPPADTLTQRSLEMARLQARVDQRMDEYQKRPRRMFVGARAREYSFAQYVDDWRLKVERIGNLNYPEAAKRNGLYGSLVLTANINADGSLESVQIDRSSGSRVLDAAAIRIVEMAAPYSVFTEDMRNKVDILGITRTWTFTRADQLTSQ